MGATVGPFTADIVPEEAIGRTPVDMVDETAVETAEEEADTVFEETPFELGETTFDRMRLVNSTEMKGALTGEVE